MSRTTRSVYESGSAGVEVDGGASPVCETYKVEAVQEVAGGHCLRIRPNPCRREELWRGAVAALDPSKVVSRFGSALTGQMALFNWSACGYVRGTPYPSDSDSSASVTVRIARCSQWL